MTASTARASLARDFPGGTPDESPSGSTAHTAMMKVALITKLDNQSGHHVYGSSRSDLALTTASNRVSALSLFMMFLTWPLTV